MSTNTRSLKGVNTTSVCTPGDGDGDDEEDDNYDEDGDCNGEGNNYV
jgi:hypothetical protein